MKLNTRFVITALVSALALPLAVSAAQGEKKGKGTPMNFASIDKDGDGSISESEYVAALDGRAKADAAKKRFATLDKDGDGKLTKEEHAAGSKGGGKKKGDKKNQN